MTLRVSGPAVHVIAASPDTVGYKFRAAVPAIPAAQTGAVGADEDGDELVSAGLLWRGHRELLRDSTLAATKGSRGTMPVTVTVDGDTLHVVGAAASVPVDGVAVDAPVPSPPQVDLSAGHRVALAAAEATWVAAARSDGRTDPGWDGLHVWDGHVAATDRYHCHVHRSGSATGRPEAGVTVGARTLVDAARLCPALRVVGTDDVTVVTGQGPHDMSAWWWQRSIAGDFPHVNGLLVEEAGVGADVCVDGVAALGAVAGTPSAPTQPTVGLRLDADGVTVDVDGHPVRLATAPSRQVVHDGRWLVDTVRLLQAVKGMQGPGRFEVLDAGRRLRLTSSERAVVLAPVRVLTAAAAPHVAPDGPSTPSCDADQPR